MAHLSGSALVIQWITTGTVTLSGDQRTMTWNENMNIADSTAGSDTADSHVRTFRSIDGSFGLVDNGAAGSALYAAIYSGAQGTLKWFPIGTATGSPVYSILSTITQVQQSMPFDDIIDRSYNWKGNGDWLLNWERSGSTA